MNEPDPDPSGPRRRALWAMLLVAGLLVFGWWLEGKLRADSILEDCLMAGRRNCAPIAAPVAPS